MTLEAPLQRLYEGGDWVGLAREHLRRGRRLEALRWALKAHLEKGAKFKVVGFEPGHTLRQWTRPRHLLCTFPEDLSDVEMLEPIKAKLCWGPAQARVYVLELLDHYPEILARASRWASRSDLTFADEVMERGLSSRQAGEVLVTTLWDAFKIYTKGLLSGKRWSIGGEEQHPMALEILDTSGLVDRASWSFQGVRYAQNQLQKIQTIMLQSTSTGWRPKLYEDESAFVAICLLSGLIHINTEDGNSLPLENMLPIDPHPLLHRLIPGLVEEAMGGPDLAGLYSFHSVNLLCQLKAFAG